MELLENNGIGPIKTSIALYDLLKRDDVDYEKVRPVFNLPELTGEVKDQVEIMIRYEGYIKRQLDQVAHMEKLESKMIPENLDYSLIKSLRDEAREKLMAIRPASVGQAGRISGVSPADISVLMIYLEQKRREREIEDVN